MNKTKTRFLVALLALIALAPQAAFAYFTTDQKAVQINEDTLLYTVTYKFGLEKSELRMPVGAVRGLQFGDASPYVGYTLLQDSETPVTKGDTYSIVLSNMEIVDGEYYVPAGKVGIFTLVTLVKLSPDFISVEERDYNLSMRVTSLPFTMMKDGKEINAQLNPSELQYYTTPELDLK